MLLFSAPCQFYNTMSVKIAIKIYFVNQSIFFYSGNTGWFDNQLWILHSNVLQGNFTCNV